MVDRTIPWWRKALNRVLETIRTGFGLFARPAHAEEAPAVPATAQPAAVPAQNAATLYDQSKSKKHKTNKERQKIARLVTALKPAESRHEVQPGLRPTAKPARATRLVRHAARPKPQLRPAEPQPVPVPAASVVVAPAPVAVKPAVKSAAKPDVKPVSVAEAAIPPARPAVPLAAPMIPPAASVAVRPAAPVEPVSPPVASAVRPAVRPRAPRVPYTSAEPWDKSKPRPVAQQRPLSPLPKLAPQKIQPLVVPEEPQTPAIHQPALDASCVPQPKAGTQSDFAPEVVQTVPIEAVPAEVVAVEPEFLAEPVTLAEELPAPASADEDQAEVLADAPVEAAEVLAAESEAVQAESVAAAAGAESEVAPEEESAPKVVQITEAPAEVFAEPAAEVAEQAPEFLAEPMALAEEIQAASAVVEEELTETAPEAEERTAEESAPEEPAVAFALQAPSAPEAASEPEVVLETPAPAPRVESEYEGSASFVVRPLKAAKSRSKWRFAAIASSPQTPETPVEPVAEAAPVVADAISPEPEIAPESVQKVAAAALADESAPEAAELSAESVVEEAAAEELVVPAELVASELTAEVEPAEVVEEAAVESVAEIAPELMQEDFSDAVEAVAEAASEVISGQELAGQEPVDQEPVASAGNVPAVEENSGAAAHAVAVEGVIDALRAYMEQPGEAEPLPTPSAPLEAEPEEPADPAAELLAAELERMEAAMALARAAVAASFEEDAQPEESATPAEEPVAAEPESAAPVESAPVEVEPEAVEVEPAGLQPEELAEVVDVPEVEAAQGVVDGPAEDQAMEPAAEPASQPEEEAEEDRVEPVEEQNSEQEPVAEAVVEQAVQVEEIAAPAPDSTEPGPIAESEAAPAEDVLAEEVQPEAEEESAPEDATEVGAAEESVADEEVTTEDAEPAGAGPNTMIAEFLEVAPVAGDVVEVAAPAEEDAPAEEIAPAGEETAPEEVQADELSMDEASSDGPSSQDEAAEAPAEQVAETTESVEVGSEVPAEETAQTAAAVAQPADGDDPEEPSPVVVDNAPTHPMIKREITEDAPFAILVNQVYEGPLDLLLDLIRKQDIDIYDIPIAKITAQFLTYVNKLKATDVDVAGEFIYMASLLIHIKSKMLLPRTPLTADDAAEDPRRELVERLLEHERFKNAAQMLLEKQMLEAASWTNPGMKEFRKQVSTDEDQEIVADTTDLVRIFRDILDRVRNRPMINVEEDSVTVGQMMQFLSRRLTMEDRPIALRKLLANTRSEKSLIAMFLALLELVRLQAILLRQDAAFSDIFVKKHAGFEQVMNQRLAESQDEWR